MRRDKEFLVSSEGVSKTNQGGLKHRKLCPRSCKLLNFMRDDFVL